MVYIQEVQPEESRILNERSNKKTSQSRMRHQKSNYLGSSWTDDDRAPTIKESANCKLLCEIPAILMGLGAVRCAVEGAQNQNFGPTRVLRLS